MAMHWLIQCKTCTGWTLVTDTRDIFFQQTEKGKWKSFSEFLGAPPAATDTGPEVKDVYLVEEYAVRGKGQLHMGLAAWRIHIAYIRLCMLHLLDAACIPLGTRHIHIVCTTAETHTVCTTAWRQI
jgi:hypothetical protein